MRVASVLDRHYGKRNIAVTVPSLYRMAVKHRPEFSTEFGATIMGVIYAYLTGEYVTEESAAHGDAESRGWVDPSYSMRELFDSRNDVCPVIKVWEDHKNLPDALPSTADEDFADEIHAALDLLGAYEDSGDGTFYGVDAQVWDHAEQGHYMYALHFTVKRGDTEVPWHPCEAGIEV